MSQYPLAFFCFVFFDPGWNKTVLFYAGSEYEKGVEKKR